MACPRTCPLRLRSRRVSGLSPIPTAGLGRSHGRRARSQVSCAAGGRLPSTRQRLVELDDARHATHRLIGARRYFLFERRLGPPPPGLDTRRLAWPCEAELRRWAGWRSRVSL